MAVHPPFIDSSACMKRHFDGHHVHYTTKAKTVHKYLLHSSSLEGSSSAYTLADLVLGDHI
jgi:hypothetical protein